MEPVQVFFCYARDDEQLRDALEQHLGALKRSEHAVIWHDRKIQPGTDWEKEINLHISTADIILLLVSSHFIASDYCYSIEMQKALEKHEAGKAHVIPIILRPVDWKETPLGKLQALPKDGKPIVTWHTRDSAMVDIVKGIRRVITQIRTNDCERSSTREFDQIVTERVENHG